MILIAKIIHVLAFTAGIGVSITSAVIGPRQATAEPALAGQLGAIMARLGRIGSVSIILLWLTGGWLMYAIYGGSPGSGAFRLKIASVALLTAAVVALEVLGARARRTGTAPPPQAMAGLGMAVLLFAGLAVVFAVAAFL